MPKIRRLRNEDLPDGPLGFGKCVLPPPHLWERMARIPYATVRSMIQTYRETFRENAEVFKSDRSMEKKLELMRANIALTATATNHSPQGMAWLGFKLADCVCGPGLGHNAPPKQRK